TKEELTEQTRGVMKAAGEHAGQPVYFLVVVKGPQQEALFNKINNDWRITATPDPLGLVGMQFGKLDAAEHVRTRIVGPDGVIRAVKLDEDCLKSLAAKCQWKFAHPGYDPNKSTAARLMETGDYRRGMESLRGFESPNPDHPNPAAPLQGDVERVVEQEA